MGSTEPPRPHPLDCDCADCAEARVLVGLTGKASEIEAEVVYAGIPLTDERSARLAQTLKETARLGKLPSEGES